MKIKQYSNLPKISFYVEDINEYIISFSKDDYLIYKENVQSKIIDYKIPDFINENVGKYKLTIETKYKVYYGELEVLPTNINKNLVNKECANCLITINNE